MASAKQNPAYSSGGFLISHEDFFSANHGTRMSLRNTPIFSNLPEDFDLDVNPYVREIVAAKASGAYPLCFGPELALFKDKWLDHFQKSDPNVSAVYLEIGAHTGKILSAMAKDFPQYGFVGMDITFKRVVKTAKKAKLQGLNNVFSILGDGKQLDKIFGEEELSGVVVFFPDPWTKRKKQTHNRLFSPLLCEQLHQTLKPGGFVWFKSDSEAYFQSVVRWMQEANFSELFAVPPSSSFQSLPSQPYEQLYSSVFEDYFRSIQAPIFQKIWTKPPNL